MAKLTLSDPTTLNNIVSTVAANNALIEAAVEITLSRDGTAPNPMEATLDMNSNRIINLPEPSSEQEPATKDYVDTLFGTASVGGGNVVGPASSTDNAVVRFDGGSGLFVQNSSVIIDDAGFLGVGLTPSNWQFDVNQAARAQDYLIGARATGPRIAYVGDSLTVGGQGGATPYPNQITLPTWNGQSFTSTNIGVSARQIKDMSRLAYSNLNPLFANESGINIAVLWGGTNDIAIGLATPADTYSYTFALGQRLRALGWRVIVCTQISRISNDANLQTLSGYVRANWPLFADALADLQANANLGATNAYLNGTYFNADGLHLTTTGYGVAAGIIQTAITTVTSGATNAFPTRGNAVVGSANAYVGIASITPKAQLHGTDSTVFQAAFRWSADTGAANFHTYKSRGAAVGTHTIVQSGDALGGFAANASDGTNFINAALIRAVVDGTPGTNDMPGRLEFTTTADGASAGTERMRITSAGLVGIGRTPTTGLLEVAGDMYLAKGSSPLFGTLDNQILRIAVNGAEVARWDTSGNLGIGVTPVVRFHALAATTALPSLTVNQGIAAFGAANNAQLVFGADPANNFAIALQGKQSTNSGATIPISINPLGGNVGINTAVPSQALHVAGNIQVTAGTGKFIYGTNTTFDQLSNSLLGTSASIAFSVDIAGGLSLKSGRDSNDPMLFFVSGAEKARLTTAGYFGLGTTAPGYQVTAGRIYLTIKGSTLGGALEFATSEADATGNAVGLMQWTDINSTSTDKRVAFISGALLGATANKRGGRLIFATKPNNTESCVEVASINDVGNMKIGGTADRATTEGTAQLAIFNGTAPVGTLANGVSIYSASGELLTMNSAGTSTRLSLAAPTAISGAGPFAIGSASTLNLRIAVIIAGTTYWIPASTTAY